MPWKLLLQILCVFLIGAIWFIVQIKKDYIKWKDNQMSLHLFVVELCGFMLMLIFISPLPKDWKLTIGVAAAIIIGIAFFTADRSKD